MGKFRMVQTSFWSDPKVEEELTPEDKYFFLYLLTNEQTTSIGIYQITRRKMAYDLGYSLETVDALLERFMNHLHLVKYNFETRELAIKNWGRYNLKRGGKPMLDCVSSELSKVKDISLISYIGKRITNESIREIYETLGSKSYEAGERTTAQRKNERTDATRVTQDETATSNATTAQNEVVAETKTETPKQETFVNLVEKAQGEASREKPNSLVVEIAQDEGGAIGPPNNQLHAPALVVDEKQDVVQELFDHYISKNIIRHKRITPAMRRAINARLRDYTIDELKQAINNYATVYFSKNHWFTHKYPLADFMRDKDIRKFLDEADPIENFAYKQRPRYEEFDLS